jgi:hypothetical protein
VPRGQREGSLRPYSRFLDRDVLILKFKWVRCTGSHADLPECRRCCAHHSVAYSNGCDARTHMQTCRNVGAAVLTILLPTQITITTFFLFSGAMLVARLLRGATRSSCQIAHVTLCPTELSRLSSQLVVHKPLPVRNL